MAVFRDSGELYKCIGGFFRRAATDPELGSRVAASGLTIRFEYSDPEAAVSVDARNDPPDGVVFTVREGSSDQPVDVLMTMPADVAHRFWLGRVNVIAAINSGQMKVIGPITQIMKLLPILKPAFDLYRTHLTEIGYAHLLQ
jgi:hypothetical protein